MKCFICFCVKHQHRRLHQTPTTTQGDSKAHRLSAWKMNTHAQMETETYRTVLAPVPASMSVFYVCQSISSFSLCGRTRTGKREARPAFRRLRGRRGLRGWRTRYLQIHVFCDLSRSGKAPKSRRHRSAGSECAALTVGPRRSQVGTRIAPSSPQCSSLALSRRFALPFPLISLLLWLSFPFAFLFLICFSFLGLLHPVLSPGASNCDHH